MLITDRHGHGKAQLPAVPDNGPALIAAEPYDDSP